MNRILILGGIFSTTSRYNNAVFNVANSLGKRNDVRVLSMSRMPFLTPRPPKSYFTMAHESTYKRYANSCLNFPKNSKIFKRYSGLASVHELICFARFSMNETNVSSELKSNKPEVISIHSTDLERLPFISQTIESGIPSTVTLHGLYSLDVKSREHFNFIKLETEILERFRELRQHLVFPSSGLMNKVDEVFGISECPKTVIPNGVDTEKFHPIPMPKINRTRDIYGIPDGKKVITQVGSLTKVKNHVEVLKALKLMRTEERNDLRYVIVGDGPESSSLRSFVRKNDLSRICLFVGKKYGEELVSIFGSSDFVIIPSTTEVFPLVSLEAMATGTPLLIHEDIWSVMDIFDEECMTLVHNRETSCLSEAIIDALSKEWKRERIRSKALEFGWDSVSMKYENLLGSLI